MKDMTEKEFDAYVKTHGTRLPVTSDELYARGRCFAGEKNESRLDIVDKIFATKPKDIVYSQDALVANIQKKIIQDNKKRGKR